MNGTTNTPARASKADTLAALVTTIEEGPASARKAKKRLAQLVADIKIELGQVEELRRKTAETARRIGDLLNQAKALCDLTGHDWLPWLAQNFEMDQKTAWRYMQIAKRWHELGNLPNGAGITAALRMLEAADARATADVPPSSGTTWFNFLSQLTPGLAKKEQIEQSASFIFANGRITTFNGKVRCSAPSPLRDFTGAVEGKSFLDALKVRGREKVEIFADGDALVIAGKGSRAVLRVEQEIMPDMERAANDLGQPADWLPVGEGFWDALAKVQQCAGKDDRIFETICVNITPDWIEACDDTQLMRWPLATGLKENVLVRQSSIKALAVQGMTEYRLTKDWVHFRKPADGGYQTSGCYRYPDEYGDLTDYLKVDGPALVLPPGLRRAIDRAAKFSREYVDANRVLVQLGAGKLVVAAEGRTGSDVTELECEYDGPARHFLIPPLPLDKAAGFRAPVVVGKEMLKVATNEFEWVARIFPLELDGAQHAVVPMSNEPDPAPRPSHEESQVMEAPPRASWATQAMTALPGASDAMCETVDHCATKFAVAVAALLNEKQHPLCLKKEAESRIAAALEEELLRWTTATVDGYQVTDADRCTCEERYPHAPWEDDADDEEE